MSISLPPEILEKIDPIITRITETADPIQIRCYNIPIPNSLSFSLVSGVHELSTLYRLDAFGFKAVNHKIGEEELQWMAMHWKGLETVYGLVAYVDGVLRDKKADELGRRLKELVSGVEWGVFRYSDSYND